MSEQQLPPWGNDSLSEFLKATDENTRMTSLNLSKVYDLLKRVHSTFSRVDEAIEKDNRQILLISRFLIIRTHSSLLAAIRLSMSGLLAESIPLLRLAIEQAWYALHIAKDPNPPDRSLIWLCRNDDDKSKSICKTEYTVGNVRTTHESLDAATASELHQLYEELIDFGAHPNQSGILASLEKSSTDKETNYQVGILNFNQDILKWTLRMAVAVAVGTLKVFQQIFPERLILLSLDVEIEKIVMDLNTVFKS